MKRFIDVHTGEVMAGCGEVVLKSDAQSACLVIAAYDSVRKIGALAHTMFFSNPSDRNTDFMNAEETSKAIDEMIKDMALLGADKNNVEVRLVTGENVSHEHNDPMYNRHIASAVELLKQKRVKFTKNPVEDIGSSHISLDVESGKILYT